MQDLLARRVHNIEVEILAEVLALPERQCSCMFLIIAIRNEGVSYTQSARHVADQRRKKFAPCCGCSADHNRAERLFGKVSVCNVADESDYAGDLAFAIAVRSEGARLPNVVALRRVLRNQSVSHVYDFPLKRPIESSLYATRNKSRKNLGCHSA